MADIRSTCEDMGVSILDWCQNQNSNWVGIKITADESMLPVSGNDGIEVGSRVGFLEKSFNSIDNSHATHCNSDVICTAINVSPCTNAQCEALFNLCENLSLEVLELTTRYENLQQEGEQLFKQYEIRCAALKATQDHVQSLQANISKMTKEYHAIQTKYQDLCCANMELQQSSHQMADVGNISPASPTVHFTSTNFQES